MMNETQHSKDIRDDRQASVNLNYWWPVAHRDHFPKSGIRGTRIGAKELVIVRKNDQFKVYDDACPHKRVRLSKLGQLQGDQLVCTYHGWKFDCQRGACTSLDGMPGQEKQFDLNGYPMREYGGWIWVFPGDPALVDTTPLPEIAPANQPGKFYRVPMEGTVNCHFSFITENATDLFHAELHKAQQPWANPQLLSLEETDRTVTARYEVETPSPLAALFTGRGKKFIQVKYEYPYIHLYEEGGGFYLFVTYLPQDAENTYVFSSFYFPHMLKNEALSRLLLPLVEPLLIPVLNQGTFKKVFLEDIRAVEEEQRAYKLAGEDLSRDTNPVSHAVRRVILKQTAHHPALKPEPLIARPGAPA